MAIVTRALQPYPHSCYYIRCSRARHKRRSRCPGHSLKTVPDRCPAYTSGALPCTTSRRELEVLLIWGLHPRRSTSEGVCRRLLCKQELMISVLLCSSPGSV